MEPKKANLPSLPGNNDEEMWEHAEIHGNIVPQPIASGAHHIVRKSAREAYCTHCSWGIYLDAEDQIKDGHLYNKEGKLIV